MSKIISKLFIATILLAIMPVVCADPCECTGDPVEPNYGTATVDGYYSEWDLEADHFGIMYESGQDDKTHLSDAYVRYDCKNQILYVLVLLEPGKVIDDSVVDDQFVKLNCNNDKVVDDSDEGNSGPPTFSYIINGTGDKVGWEAAAKVDTTMAVESPDIYYLNVHTQVDGTEPDQTSAFIDRCIKLKICCEIPEFSTIALPIAGILGLMFILQSRRRKED